MSSFPLPPGASTAYGPALVSLDFDQAVEDMIRKWIDSYLSEMEVRMGHPRRTVDRPKSYNMAIEATTWPEDALPGILIVSAGLTETPEQVGGGLYSGWWDWAVVAIMTGRDYKATRLKTSIYQAAMSMMFTQQADEALGTTVWSSAPAAYAPVDGRSRTKGVAAFEFRTHIEAVVNGGLGPLEPDAPAPPDDPSAPHGDLPTVQTVDVELRPQADLGD